MPSQSWVQKIAGQQAQGSFLTTYTTAKSVINAEAIKQLPMGFIEAAGKMFDLEVAGSISNIVTTPGTIVFQLMFGSVIAWSSGLIQLNATAHTKLPFRLRVPLTARSVGNGTLATLQGDGTLIGPMFTKTAGQTDNVNSDTVIAVPVTSPTVGAGFDSTTSQAVDFWAGFSISNAANGIQVEQFRFISLD